MSITCSFAHDPLGRLKTATTKLSNVTRRTLSQTYDARGNLKTKTSSVGADMDVSSSTSYGVGSAGPHAVTASYVDYLHKDHLGSVEGVTGANGARTRELAHDPFGERRKADWTAALTESERLALAGSSDPRTRCHTGTSTWTVRA